MQFVGKPKKNKQLAERDAAVEALAWLTHMFDNSRDEDDKSPPDVTDNMLKLLGKCGRSKLESVNIPNDQYQQYERFSKALQDGDLNATKEFITQRPNAVRTIITESTGRTALHVAAIAGHTEIVATLVEKMSPEDLEMKDSSYVALHLLLHCPQLAATFDLSTRTPVHILAMYPSGRRLKFWQKWIYKSIVIDEDRVIKEIYTKLPINSKMSSVLPEAQPDRPSGAALQMLRELQWFRVVESIVPPWTYGHTNSRFLTLRQLFIKEHQQLLYDGDRWMKETATSCTVVGTLIVTIMFAATFTVPGGNDERTGYPKFLDDKTFMFYVVSDAISLFSSITSVLVFLGIYINKCR
ncbi:ankyrin repeat-containing protein NPR4-like [Ziziphus jujuba]|uniref:Ankyrin repeat-containing protein NPR4-like n=1 Tax=Ziziphus jujuba TaxID=326968 RepID=A0ABM4AGA2_ZIZJJ|nr:ankyrin repeat-containing protein NPR4-like [Ziziphus jujuba]